ncbi:MAG: hypothetical protein LBD45_03225 [Bacteroidales bacterium]|nr:hypothetical protein [Bacteroidales bacterium]
MLTTISTASDLIRHLVHQSDESNSYYGIYAFSTKGEIEAETLGRGSNAIPDKPLVIYAHCDGGDYIYPVQKTTLFRQ